MQAMVDNGSAAEDIAAHFMTTPTVVRQRLKLASVSPKLHDIYAEDGMSLVREFDNVVVTRTFSKLHGLAALRVGWAYMPAEMAGAMDRIRLPFNVNIPAQLAAVAALADDEFQERSLALVDQWRPWLAQQLGGLGLEPLPSAANFVLVGFPITPGKTAKEADAFLTQRGLILRAVGGYGLPDALRMTIGSEEANRLVVAALADFLKA